MDLPCISWFCRGWSWQSNGVNDFWKHKAGQMRQHTVSHTYWLQEVTQRKASVNIMSHHQTCHVKRWLPHLSPKERNQSYSTCHKDKCISKLCLTMQHTVYTVSMTSMYSHTVIHVWIYNQISLIWLSRTTSLWRRVHLHLFWYQWYIYMYVCMNKLYLHFRILKWNH